MAAMPAYRYDYAHQAQPSRRGYEVPETPPVRVLPGRKTSSNPGLSERHIAIAKLIVIGLIAFLIVGFIRVSIASAAYTTASQVSQLRTDISAARTTGESLVIEESKIIGDANTKSMAMQKFGLVEPGVSTTIVLPVDIVALNSDGNLSLSQSIANASIQG
ncbi:MAG: hypothetical protein ACI4BI_04070 [Anaerotardibacter sp.]